MNKTCHIIREDYFDRILSGELKQWFLPVTPRSIKGLIQLNDKGFEIEDEGGNSLPVNYDAIEFMVCRDSKWDIILVQILNAHTETFCNDNGEPFWYQHSEHDWVVQQVVYDLGDIIEKKLYIPRNEQGERLPLITKPKSQSSPIIEVPIKQEDFDLMLVGKIKKVSYEINPTVSRKFVETESDGTPIWSGDFNSIPIHYDSIRFRVIGKGSGRDSILVEIKDTYTEIPCINGSQVFFRRINGDDWFIEDVVYVLGRIIRKNVHDKS